ncbi:UNVERIFIED_CONTAM: hypothetical protein NCL1_62671 [Trichonephila clavipes]
MQADQWMTPDDLGKAYRYMTLETQILLRVKTMMFIYVDVIVNDTPLSATLDSGTNSVIINTKYVSEEKRIHSQIVLTSYFGECFRIYDLIEGRGKEKNISGSERDRGSNILTLESF